VCCLFHPTNSFTFTPWVVTHYSRCFSSPRSVDHDNIDCNDAVFSSVAPTMPSSVKTMLLKRGISVSTPIQRNAFKSIYERKSIALHSETGSGKVWKM
jgi:hypothetical protein